MIPPDAGPLLTGPDHARSVGIFNAKPDLARPLATADDTRAGEQTLVPGVRPVTLKDRLEARMVMPMAPRRNPDAGQRPLDIGLFDEAARSQLDLLDLVRGR